MAMPGFCCYGPRPMSSKSRIAHRLSQVKPSATVAISQRARELRVEGVDVLSFSVGEPDFGPPSHVLDAVRNALEEPGNSKYTTVRGTVPLRKAICEHSKAFRGGQEHDPSEVVVSVGAKHSLYNLAMALFDPGHEVIIPAPYWVSYPEQVRLAGAEPVIIPTGKESKYRLTPDQLQSQLRPQTRAVVLCTPSNPTGSAYSESELRGLAEVLRGHDCYIIVDEIYAQLVYGDFQQKSLLEVAPDLRERLIIVDGVSKSFAMTGWRIGWILAPKDVAAACDKVQSQSTTNPTAIAQVAAEAALRGPQEPIEAMRKSFETRRALMVEGLSSIPGFACEWPEGAFYAFVDVTGLVGKRAGGKVLEDDLAVAGFLLDEARCAVVPGTAFGAPGHVRISYAASEEQLAEGLRRMREAVATLSDA